MKILMDSDCLIKLTKAGIKESICQYHEVFLPEIVQREVVEAGGNKGYHDAHIVAKNIEREVIRVAKEPSHHSKGDQSLIEIFKTGNYETVATDDAKLVRILRLSGVPYILPGVLIYFHYRKGAISKKIAISWLNKLSDYISDDEYSMIKSLMGEGV